MSNTPQYSETNAIALYLALAHEIDIRLDLVKAASTGELSLPKPYAREFVYLQFRRICELVALGLVTIHGYVDGLRTSRMRKEWHAEELVKAITQHHEYGFPQCVTIESHGERVSLNANSNPNALTMSEFSKLYNECGSVLHRGTVKTIEHGEEISQDDYARIPMWQSKIVDLLNSHLITTKTDHFKKAFVVRLRADNNLPACDVYTFEDVGVSVNSHAMHIDGKGEAPSGKVTKVSSKFPYFSSK